MRPTPLYPVFLAPWLHYTCLFSILLFLPRILAQETAQNTTISLTSPQIIYTPFLCSRDSTSEDCNGGWVQQQGDRLMPAILTTGPDPKTNNIIPQMFLEFRGSALYLFASPTSNAQANITITTNRTTISATFDSTLRQASILNLNPSLITKFALTFLPANVPRVFSLTSMIITVPNGTLTTTLPILPSMTLPPSSSAPIFTPTSSTSSSNNPTITTPSPSTTSNPESVSSSKRTNIAIAVGVTLGLGLGLSAIAGAGFWLYRRRRPKRRWGRSLMVDRTRVNTGEEGGGGDNVSRISGGEGEGGGRGLHANEFLEIRHISSDPTFGIAFTVGEGRPRSVSPPGSDS